MQDFIFLIWTGFYTFMFIFLMIASSHFYHLYVIIQFINKLLIRLNMFALTLKLRIVEPTYVSVYILYIMYYTYTHTQYYIL